MEKQQANTAPAKKVVKPRRTFMEFIKKYLWEGNQFEVVFIQLIYYLLPTKVNQIQVFRCSIRLVCQQKSNLILDSFFRVKLEQILEHDMIQEHLFVFLFAFCFLFCFLLLPLQAKQAVDSVSEGFQTHFAYEMLCTKKRASHSLINLLLSLECRQCLTKIAKNILF